MAGAAAALRLRARRRALRRGKAPKPSKQSQAPKAPPPKRVKKSRAPPQQSSQAAPQQSQAAPPATQKQKPLQLINEQLKLAKQAGGTPALGRSADAEAVLRAKFPEARFRLSDEVLRYGAAPAAAPPALAPRQCAAFDDALPGWLFDALARCFAADGGFWPAHGYDVDGGGAGFFSYVHSIADDDSDSDGDDEPATRVAARALRGLFARAMPQLEAARAVEWWAHCRPHGCGHQLHFDSADEGRHDGEGPRHPIASVVVYLTETLGGPTLVTTQTIADARMPVRDCASLVPPKANRCAAFDGRLLHCVVPGRGAAPDPCARRVTLMISYWREPHAAPAAGGGARAAMRFPRRAAAPRKRKPAAPVAVGRLWTAVPDGGDDGRAAVPLPPYDACFQ
ncbi:hypothetical protein JL720_238 [Aureococcus anophagefferens]|nr:hypothetical protein JL720_238 [Aureococcus anophagefferens]